MSINECIHALIKIENRKITVFNKNDISMGAVEQSPFGG